MVAPADWNEVRLGEICEFVKTIALSRSQLEADHGVGCIHYGDIHTKFNDRLDCSNVQLPMAESGMVAGVPRLKVGDLVIADASEDMTGVGKGIEILGIPEDGVVAGLHTAVLRPRVGHFAKGFLGQLQHMPKFKEQARVLASGLKVYGLSKTAISKISVEIPPLKEQEAIAEALSDVDAAIESLDALIAKKRDVKQATMQQLLSGRTRLPGFTADWKEVKVAEAIVDSFSGPSPTCLERNIQGDEWGVFKTTCSTNEKGWDYTKHKVLPRAFWGMTRSLIEVGDTVITKAGPRHRVGVASYVNRTLDRLIVSGKMIGLRPKTTVVCPPFLALALSSKPTQEFLNQRTTGMAESQVNFENVALLETTLYLPPLKEQEAIAEALTVIDDELEALTAQVSKLRMVKEGMMQDLLTGKVRLV